MENTPKSFLKSCKLKQMNWPPYKYIKYALHLKSFKVTTLISHNWMCHSWWISLTKLCTANIQQNPTWIDVIDHHYPVLPPVPQSNRKVKKQHLITTTEVKPNLLWRSSSVAGRSDWGCPGQKIVAESFSGNFPE